MFTSIEATRRFAKIFAESSRHLRIMLRAGKGRPEVPRDVFNRELIAWGRESLANLKVELEVIGQATQEPVLFIGNHISYVDIPLLASQAPIMFVAKKELATWPVFGTAIRKLGMVLVDRNAANSRASASQAVAACIKERKQSVAIFPSGTTTVAEQKPWRWGAFQIADRFGLPIQPFRMTFEPLRKVAYIDDDVFAPHLWNLLRVKKIHARIEFAPVTTVTDAQEDCLRWQAWCREWFKESYEYRHRPSLGPLSPHSPATS